MQGCTTGAPYVPAGYEPPRTSGLFVTVKTADREVPTLKIPISFARQAAGTVLRPMNTTTRPVIRPGGAATRPALRPLAPATPRTNQQ